MSRATSLVDKIKAELKFENVEIVEGRAGIFLVELNGKEIFHNKKEQMKNPDEAEIIERIRKEL